MVNFGERIAYWYLRLNGFLLVEDFVLHRQAGRRTSDVDLLGVRLRHSAESIDNTPLQLHSAIQQFVGEEADPKHVALVVQVKTGAAASAGRAFDAERLRHSLRFVGAVPEAALEGVVQELGKNATSSQDGWLFAKLLIAEEPRDTSAVGVSLKDAFGFIEDRLKRHVGPKTADRLFFPDELMQFLAWRAGQEGPAHG